MTDILNSDALLLTTADDLVICVPNKDSTASLAQQQLTKCSLRHSILLKDLKAISTTNTPIRDKRWIFHHQLFAEFKKIKDEKFQTLLSNFVHSFWLLPNEIYLPVLIDDKIIELTPDIVERYEEQIISEKSITDYEEQFAYQAQKFKKFHEEFKAIKKYLSNPKFPLNIPDWLSKYGVKDTETLFNFIYPGYTQDSELEYWLNLAVANPYFLTQADNHLLYRGSQLQSSIQQLIELPSLGAFPNSYVIFLQEALEKGIFFLHYEVKGKKALYTFTDKVEESLGVFFSEEQLKNSSYTNFRALPEEVFLGHYQNGKLKEFKKLTDSPYEDKEKLVYLSHLNIILEQTKLQYTLSTLSPTSKKRFKV